jgi:hypothetical protein
VTDGDEEGEVLGVGCGVTGVGVGPAGRLAPPWPPIGAGVVGVVGVVRATPIGPWTGGLLFDVGVLPP